MWRYRIARKDVLSKLPTFDSASLLRSSSLCLRRGRRRSFTGPISAHHDGLRGTPSTSTLGLALGRACRLRVEAPLRASLAATHALLAIASERSGAERPVPTLIVVHDPRSPCEGSQGAVHPVIPLEILREPLVDRVQINDEEATHKSIMAHHDGTRRATRGRACRDTRCSLFQACVQGSIDPRRY